MATRLFSRTPLHEHPEAAQRILGVAQLAPDSSELAGLIATDPAPEVRSAAAARSTDLAALDRSLGAGDRSCRASRAGARTGQRSRHHARWRLRAGLSRIAGLLRCHSRRRRPTLGRGGTAPGRHRRPARREPAHRTGARGRACGDAARRRRMRALSRGPARAGGCGAQQGSRCRAPRQATPGGDAEPRGPGHRGGRDTRGTGSARRDSRPHPHGGGGTEPPLAGPGHAPRRRTARALRRGAACPAGALRSRTGRAARAHPVRAPRQRVGDGTRNSRWAGCARRTAQRSGRPARGGTGPGRCTGARETCRGAGAPRGLGTGTSGARRGRGARGRGGTSRGGHLRRQRPAARALAGAGPRDPHAGAHAPLRNGSRGGRAAPARAGERRARGSQRGAQPRARAAAHGRAGAGRGPAARGARRRRRDEGDQVRRRDVAEAHAAAHGPRRAAAGRTGTLGVVRPAQRAPATVRTRRGGSPRRDWMPRALRPR